MKCDICKVEDEKVEIFCGGLIGKAHPQCAEQFQMSVDWLVHLLAIEDGTLFRLVALAIEKANARKQRNDLR